MNDFIFAGLSLEKENQISTPFKKMGKNVEKKMEKVEKKFRSNPFSQGCRNLILFFQTHSSENEIVHIKL